MNSNGRCIPTFFFVLSISLLISSGMMPLVAHAQDKSANTQEKPLFPLKRGLKWEFEVSETVNGIPDPKSSGKMLWQVGDIVIFNNVSCTEVIQTELGVDRRRIWYGACRDGYLLHYGWKDDADSKKTTTYIYQPYHRMCCLSPGTAVSWTSDFKEFDPVEIEKLKKEVDKNYDWRRAKRIECTQSPDKVKYKGVEHEAVLVVSVEVDDPKSGKERVRERNWYIPGVGIAKREFTYANDPRTVTRWQLIAHNGRPSVSFGEVVVRPATVEKEVSVESVEAPAGVATKFKRSRTITREASWSLNASVGAEFESKLTVDLGLVRDEFNHKIKIGVEAAMGEKLTDSETREQEVTIDGNTLPKAKIAWIDVYRTGTVEVAQDGKTFKIPFEFPIGTKLVIRKQ